jgi:hypothetical protein
MLGARPVEHPGRRRARQFEAFRVLGEIAKLEIFETETFPAEDVETFFKVFV